MSKRTLPSLVTSFKQLGVFCVFNCRSKLMSGNNAQMIRGALVDLIKFYVGREITLEELSQIIGFICAVHDEILVSIDL